MSATVISPFENMTIEDMPALPLVKRKQQHQRKMADDDAASDSTLIYEVPHVFNTNGSTDSSFTAAANSYNEFVQEKTVVYHDYQEPPYSINIPQQQEQCRQQKPYFLPVHDKGTHFHSPSSPSTPSAVQVPHAYSHPDELILASPIPPPKPAVSPFDLPNHQQRQSFGNMEQHYHYPVLNNFHSADSLLDDTSSSSSSIATLAHNTEETEEAIKYSTLLTLSHELFSNSYHYQQNIPNFVITPSCSSTASLRTSSRLSSIKSRFKKAFSPSKQQPQQQQQQQQQQLQQQWHLQRQTNAYNNQCFPPAIPIAASTLSESTTKENHKMLTLFDTAATLRHSQSKTANIGEHDFIMEDIRSMHRGNDVELNSHQYQTEAIQLKTDMSRGSMLRPHRTSSLPLGQQQQQQELQERQQQQQQKCEDAFTVERRQSYNTDHDKKKKRKSRKTTVLSFQNQPLQQIQFMYPTSSMNTTTTPATTIHERDVESSPTTTARVTILKKSSIKQKKNGSNKQLKKVTFDILVSVYNTYARQEYDRSASVNMDQFQMNSISVERIKQELNHYKMNEMEVHRDSVKHTHLLM